jgi:hypothetical protein
MRISKKKPVFKKTTENWTVKDVSMEPKFPGDQRLKSPGETDQAQKLGVLNQKKTLSQDSRSRRPSSEQN